MRQQLCFNNVTHAWIWSWNPPVLSNEIKCLAHGNRDTLIGFSLDMLGFVTPLLLMLRIRNYQFGALDIWELIQGKNNTG